MKITSKEKSHENAMNTAGKRHQINMKIASKEMKRHEIDMNRTCKRHESKMKITKEMKKT
jgi:hypothetical protein